MVLSPNIVYVYVLYFIIISEPTPHLINHSSNTPLPPPPRASASHSFLCVGVRALKPLLLQTLVTRLNYNFLQLCIL